MQTFDLDKEGDEEAILHFPQKDWVTMTDVLVCLRAPMLHIQLMESCTLYLMLNRYIGTWVLGGYLSRYLLNYNLF